MISLIKKKRLKIVIKQTTEKYLYYIPQSNVCVRM